MIVLGQSAVAAGQSKTGGHGALSMHNGTTRNWNSTWTNLIVAWFPTNLTKHKNMEKNTDKSAAKPDEMRKVLVTLRSAFRNSYFSYKQALLGDKEKAAEAGGTSAKLEKK